MRHHYLRKRALTHKLINISEGEFMGFRPVWFCGLERQVQGAFPLCPEIERKDSFGVVPGLECALVRVNDLRGLFINGSASGCDEHISPERYDKGILCGFEWDCGRVPACRGENQCRQHGFEKNMHNLSILSQR